MTKPEADTAPPSRARKLFLAAVTVALALILLEALLALVEPLYLTRLRNPFDRHGRTLVVRRGTGLAVAVVGRGGYTQVSAACCRRGRF